MTIVTVRLRGVTLRRWFADVPAAMPFVRRWQRAGLVIIGKRNT